MSDICEVLKNRIDIRDYIEQYTEVKKDGRIYRAPCPIHQESNPSLTIYPDTMSYYCFGCGSGGDVINFVQDLEKIEFDEAIIKLADYANIDIEHDETYKKQRSAYQKNQQITEKFKRNVGTISNYLLKRGFTNEIIDEFDLGWNDKEKSIVIPIRDHNKRVVAFSRRFMYTEPKYRNSRNNDIYDKSKVLFNLDRAKRMITDRLYIVEGYLDAISGHQQGIPTVAYCSSELTKEHIKLISKVVQNNPNITIILVPDNDVTGQSKVSKMREKFMEVAPKLDVRVLQFPGVNYKDADEDSLYYKDFNDLLKDGVDIASLSSEHIDQYVLKQKLEVCKTPESESIVAEDFCRTIKNEMVKARIALYLADKWKMKLEEVKEFIKVTAVTDDDVLDEFINVDRAMSEYKDAMEGEYITLGYAYIDASIRGLRLTDVLIFGAYSGVGKTFYANEFAIHMAVRLSKNVLIFSLEMPAGMFMERTIANVMGVSTIELEKMVKSSDKWAEIYATVKAKLNQRIKIIDRNNLSIGDINKRIKIANARLWDNGRTEVVVIDYFQYLKNTENYEKASETARQLKATAKENCVLIICLSQLNRTGRPWEGPTMLELKGTGDLEASADLILLAWRPGENPELPSSEKEKLENIIHLTIAKARRGIIGARDHEHIFLKDKTQIREVTY